jgi:hypothetical protein
VCHFFWSSVYFICIFKGIFSLYFFFQIWHLQKYFVAKDSRKTRKSWVGSMYLMKRKKKKFISHSVDMSIFGFPLTSFDLRCVVKTYLDRTGKKASRFRNNLRGPDWAESFIRRHSDNLTQRMARNITYCNVLGGSIHDGTLLHSKKSIHYS